VSNSTKRDLVLPTFYVHKEIEDIRNGKQCRYGMTKKYANKVGMI